MTIEERLAAQGGCARRKDLVRSRADITELALLVADGRVRRVRHGVYAFPTTASDVITAALVSGAISCVSAARRWGLPLLHQPAVDHVAVPGHRASARPGLLPRGTVVHWDNSLRDGARIANPATALVHATRCLPFREAVALIDGALNRKVVRLEDLPRPRSGHDRIRFDRVLRAVDGRSQSIPETFMRLAIRRAGLGVEPQQLILGVGHVDLLVEDLLVVETDGFAYHADRTAFREDRRRDRVLLALDRPVMRFTYHDAVDATEQSVFEVMAMVDRARQRGVRPLPAELLGRPQG